MLTIETLRKNSAKFAKEFADSTYEMGEAQDFIRDLCKIFELSHRRFVSFERRVKKLGNKQGRIDGFIPGLLLIEMKSAGEDLDKAYNQATEYFHGLKDEELPRCVLVSDFQNLHLYNLETHSEPLKIKLAELPQHIEHFQFLAGYEQIAVKKEEHINKEAAEKMAVLHDAIKATGYTGKDLENYLVRLLFCLFADDTGLFGENGLFLNYLKNYTQIDGSDLHEKLDTLFKTLNRSSESRLKNLPEHLKTFPYINGSLFESALAECYFDEQARNILLECAQLDWSEISPAIFGSLFQAIMHFDDEQLNAKAKKRREFGAHYTSEENILKTIKPLFLDDLQSEFEKIRKVKTKLNAFHKKISELNFFDPACGCGNFLIIAYRELRLLELEVIKARYGDNPMAHLSVNALILCDVDKFHGIDIDESAVHIATLAMWLVDHQMNLKVLQFGEYYSRIPLLKKANIVQANALQLDWEEVIKPKQCHFIMGNPPFIGKKEQKPQQKSDLQALTVFIKGAGVLDYVTGWYIKATAYIKKNPKISVAFVSTNSICQGEQVGTLWSYLLSQSVKIRFAYRTFKWSNEGRGVAAVHCVIIGFGLKEPEQRFIFDGEKTIKANNINPYLVDASNVFIEKRSTPLANSPSMNYGSMPIDNGHLILSEEEKQQLLSESKDNKKYIFQYLGGDEFINNKKRYCLWLKKAKPEDLNKSVFISERLKQVKDFRNSSDRETTKNLAKYSSLFGEIRQPESNYLLLPKVSSENREFMPIGFINKSIIVNGSALLVPNATKYHFGILQSSMHNAWMRAVCGRMKSDYQYSASLVYNNFPWCNPTEAQQKTIEEKAQAVLDARAKYKKSTLADLYNPLTMPPNLVKAHSELDKAVDVAYSYEGKKDDADRVAFLFELYQKLTSPLMETEPAKKVGKTAKKSITQK